jgi:hypothetical protein
METIKQLEVIQTKKNGVFVKERSSREYYEVNLSMFLFDGKSPKPSFNKHWFVLEKVPSLMQQYVKQKDINHRYELIDTSMRSEKIPLVFKRDDVAEYDHDEYCWRFKSEYQYLRSLYALKSDPQPDKLEDVPFEIIANITLDEVQEHKGFEFPVYKTNYKSEGETKITQNDVTYQLLDRLVFPDIVLPERPCKLTSKQTFDIIRKHVNENIITKYAKITSDYAFCFGVSKVVPLHEPLVYTVDKNAGTKRKPKFEKRYQNARDIPIFEMTHAEEKYRGYTCIEPFIGDNQEDLEKNIKTYLDKLMDFINDPLEDCPHCKGKGVILNKSLDIE